MPAKVMSDSEFVKEMRILWQNLDVEQRNKLGDIIREFFDCGARAGLIIYKLQCKI
uniref:Uncharacterized protein n=2 Tax=viral metagenome TaxID=1070528 RepID=A0A6M3J3K9_9ZZZZ